MTEDLRRGPAQRITRQGEDALGKLAQDLLENPLVNGAITRAFDAQKKAAQAQEVAMGALNIPSASDIERLTRRVRSVSQRLEGIEDGVDRLDENLDRAAGAATPGSPSASSASRSSSRSWRARSPRWPRRVPARPRPSPATRSG